MKLRNGVALLSEFLDRGPADNANDLLSVIFTGEPVIRKLQTVKLDLDLFGSVKPFSTAKLIESAESAVNEYLKYLQDNSVHFMIIMNGLEEDLDDALQGVRDFAVGANTLDAEDTLRNLDQVLMTVVAAYRVGAASERTVNLFGKVAYDEVKKVCTDCVDLWDEANSRQLRIGDDVEYLCVTEWMDCLAQFSYARVSLMVAARRGTLEERKQRAIDYVMAMFEKEKEKKS